MTLDEARQHIGRGVVYRPFADVIPERGVITSVNDQWVFVRYGTDASSKATEPGLLTLLKPSTVVRDTVTGDLTVVRWGDT